MIIYMSTGWQIALPIIAVIVGFIIGFLVAMKVFKRQLEKNPPVNEQMIRAMMQGMGRTPSEKQVRQIMNQMNSKK